MTLAGLGLGLGVGLPGAAQGVEVMAPHWAYQLQVGMRLEELRTVSGVTYRNVRIQALTTVQMQFSHSRGTQVELLTNIIDPNQYLDPAKVVVTPGRGHGGGAVPGGYGTVPLVGKNGPLASEMPLAVRTSSGVEKLTAGEQQQLIRWVESDGRRDPQGTGLEKLTRGEQRELIEWVSAWLTKEPMEQAGGGGQNPPDAFTVGGGRLPEGAVKGQISRFFGFAKDQRFEMRDGTKWRQLDDTRLGVSSLTSPNVVIYPWNGGWVMQVEGHDQRVQVRKVTLGE